jgi:hypothetical protein
MQLVPLQDLPDQFANCQRHFYDEFQLKLLDGEFSRNSFSNREGRRRIAQLISVSEKSIMVQNFKFYLWNQLTEINFSS